MTDNNYIVKNSIIDLHKSVLSFLEHYDEISEEQLFELEDFLNLNAVSLPEYVYNTAGNYLKTHLEPLVYRESNDGNLYQRDYLAAKSVWMKIAYSDLRPIVID